MTTSIRRPLPTALIAAALALAGFELSAADITTQLPRTVRPTHYNVAVTPDAPALTFTGRVVIAIEVLEPTASLTLHALDLTFSDVRLSGGSGAAWAAPTITLDAAAQTATFTFDKPVPRGAYQLDISYAGKIGTQAAGLFALDYDTPEGRKRALFTQFENSDARRFVPSWDEPAYKATFTLEATVPGRELAVSNMPVLERTEASGGRARVRFAKSPRMSSYLLFLAVGDLGRATTRVGPTEIGVVTQKGATAQADFALQSSAIVLREYNDYFATPYPLPKLDNIAGPGRSQFFGAMENWGAIFTFEHTLLLDPTISTESDRQRIFKVAAHEIAHQWFGNLVTMAWWDDLWLNEGFASWMAGRMTEKLHPEWKPELAAVEERDRAMARDALRTTHPVVQHIETVEQASQAFDVITYEKGEAVIRMLEGYVGPEAWRAGVRSYMKRHAYGNTVSDDLWREVEAAAGQPILAIAHEFTLQPGVPLITVEEGECRGGARQVTLRQGEFSRDQREKKPLTWRVPVILKSRGLGAAVRTLVDGGQATVSVPGCDPVVVNAGQSGYYRALYAPASFARIAASFPGLPAVDQLGILADTSALGRVGLQPAGDVLELARVTPQDADPQVWGRLARLFVELDEEYRGVDSPARAALRAFALARLRPVFERIGWSGRAGEAAPEAILRGEILASLGALGDKAVIDEARRRYAAQVNDRAALPGRLRKTLLGVVARHADAATWERLREEARAEKTPLVKNHLYSLLSSTEDPGLARRALELALTAEPGATNSAAMIAEVAKLHPELAFDFALGHRVVVEQRIDASSRSRYYARLARESADPAMIAKLRDYATAHLEASSRGETDNAAAQIADRIRVRREVLPAIEAWLSRQGG
jgi:aminopeptidase N